MAGLRRKGGGGGVLRTLERMGVTRGVFGASRGWFYVGTGLWTLRKVRSLGERKTEILLQEPLRPGDRVTIANGVATIQSQIQVPQAVPTGRGGRPSRRTRRRQRRADRKALITQHDLTRRRRRRRAEV